PSLDNGLVTVSSPTSWEVFFPPLVSPTQPLSSTSTWVLLSSSASSPSAVLPLSTDSDVAHSFSSPTCRSALSGLPSLSALVSTMPTTTTLLPLVPPSVSSSSLVSSTP